MHRPITLGQDEPYRSESSPCFQAVQAKAFSQVSKCRVQDECRGIMISSHKTTIWQTEAFLQRTFSSNTHAGAFWKPSNHYINHHHALVMSLCSSIKPCISYHLSGITHNMNLTSKSLETQNLTPKPNIAWPFQSPVLVWQFISKSSSRLATYFKSPVPVWKFISKPSSHLAIYFKVQFSSGKPF